MDLKETRLTSEPVLENSFLNVHRDTIRLPNGHTHERVVVRHPGASCVLALTAEEKGAPMALCSGQALAGAARRQARPCR